MKHDGRPPAAPAPVPDEVRARLAALAATYVLPVDATTRLAGLLSLIEGEPSSITSVRDPARAVDVHVADSLVALEVEELRSARNLADLGPGGGFPGLVLAIASPTTEVALVESIDRKCRFLAAAVASLGIANATVVQRRAEAWPEGLAAHDVVTARALAPLTVLLEYAAPLLALGGVLVAWKGAVDAAEKADGHEAARALGMSPPVARPVSPFVASRARTLYLSSKLSATPPSYPRRPGMARKNPIQASTRG